MERPEEKKAVLFRLFNLLIAAGPFAPVEAGDEASNAARTASHLATTGQAFAMPEHRRRG